MSKQRNRALYLGILGIAVAGLLPLSFYLIAKLLKKDHINLPRYYVADSIKTRIEGGETFRDTVFHQVADLRGVNQLGDHVSLNEDLKGKVLVVNFFFTNCLSICPRLTNHMKMLQRAFRKDPKKRQTLEESVHLVSITVNPERDSFQALRAYSERYDVNHDHWWFLTGDKKELYSYARNELALATGSGDGGADDFIHSEKIIVIDQQRYIRGYYDGLDSISVGKAANDISLITLEKKKKKN